MSIVLSGAAEILGKVGEAVIKSQDGVTIKSINANYDVTSKVETTTLTLSQELIGVAKLIAEAIVGILPAIENVITVTLSGAVITVVIDL